MAFNNSYCCPAFGVGHNTFYKENEQYSYFSGVSFQSFFYLKIQ